MQRIFIVTTLIVSFCNSAIGAFFQSGKEYTCYVTANAGLSFDKRLGSWQPTTFKKYAYKMKETTYEDKKSNFWYLSEDWKMYDASDPNAIIYFGTCSMRKNEDAGEYMACKPALPNMYLDVDGTEGRFFVMRSGAMPHSMSGDDAIMETGFCEVNR